MNERAPERPSGGWVAWWYLLLGTALLSGAVTVAWTHLRADGLTVAAAGGLVGLLAGAAAVDDRGAPGLGAIEGEGDGSLALWRRAHEAFFARECARIGRTRPGRARRGGRWCECWVLLSVCER